MARRYSSLFNNIYPWRNGLILEEGPLVPWLRVNAPPNVPDAKMTRIVVRGFFSANVFTLMNADPHQDLAYNIDRFDVVGIRHFWGQLVLCMLKLLSFPIEQTSIKFPHTSTPDSLRTLFARSLTLPFVTRVTLVPRGCDRLLLWHVYRPPRQHVWQLRDPPTRRVPTGD